VQPAGGHAIFLDARCFCPHLSQKLFPAQTLATELHPDSRTPSMERLIVSAVRNTATGDHHRPKLELMRLTIPRRVFRQAHMDIVADSVKAAYDAPERTHGLKIVYEPAYLRFFQARSEKLQPGAPHLVAQMPESTESMIDSARRPVAWEPSPWLPVATVRTVHNGSPLFHGATPLRLRSRIALNSLPGRQLGHVVVFATASPTS